jgi:hypothetical protein
MKTPAPELKKQGYENKEKKSFLPGFYLRRINRAKRLGYTLCKTSVPTVVIDLGEKDFCEVFPGRAERTEQKR